MILPLQQGILDKYNIELIGAKLPSIDKAEDRELFKQVGMHCACAQPESAPQHLSSAASARQNCACILRIKLVSGKV